MQLHRIVVVALGLAFAHAAALAQAVVDDSQVEIKVTRLADDFYTLEGRGGRTSVLTGADGVLIVDSQYATLTERLVAAIRRFSDRPIRFLVDTHVHPDHTGGNENLGRLGATIFARETLRERLLHPTPGVDGTTRAPTPPAGLPVVTYEAPVSLHIDGERVVLWPIDRAHTDGDTVVIFPAHDILAVGDIYRSVGYPYVDLAMGGSLAGELEGLSEIIDRAGPATRIIPGHGPIVDRRALVAQRDLILAVRAKVVALVAQGKSLDEVVAMHPTAPYDAQVPQAAETADRFVRWVYAEVVADK